MWLLDYFECISSYENDLLEKANKISDREEREEMIYAIHNIFNSLRVNLKSVEKEMFESRITTQLAFFQ